MQETAYIGFGSNMGDLHKNFLQAQKYLGTHPQIELLRTSNAYQTEPLTKETTEKQSWYLNAVFEITTSLTIRELFASLQNIEKSMGRTSQKKRWQPRILDLDILFYGQFVYQDTN